MRDNGGLPEDLTFGSFLNKEIVVEDLRLFTVYAVVRANKSCRTRWPVVRFEPLEKKT